MRKITVFTHVTVDGFFAGPQGEIDWFKSIEKDDEWDAYTRQGASAESTLLFGRKTYDMMKSYWPTAAARKNDPAMAAVMNNSPKVVMSKKMRTVDEEPHWTNVTVLHDLDRASMTKLKQEPGGDITVLGSGQITRQLANLGLIDKYELVVVPIVLGHGKPLFEDVKKMEWKLLAAKSFKNGLVSHRYRSM